MIELKEYRTEGALSCFAACIKNMLTYYKIPVEEYIIYCLGGGFTYAYERDFSFHNNNYRLHTDVPLTLLKFLDIFHIIYTQVLMEEDENAEQYLVDNLSRGEPVMVQVMAEDLAYDPEYINNLKEWAHMIVITGIDLEQRSIKISDGYIPTTPPKIFEGWYPYDVIKKSRSKRNNRYFTIDSRSLEQLRHDYRQGILMEKYFIPRLKESLEQLLCGKKIGESYFGVYALEAYHEYLLSLKGCRRDELKKELYRQNIDLKVEGFIDYKKYMIDSIKTISDLKKSEQLKGVLEKVTANYKSWEKFCLLLVKVSLSQDIGKVQLVADKFKEIYQSELNIASEILKYI